MLPRRVDQIDKLVLSSLKTEALVGELFERGVLLAAQQDVFLPSLVVTRMRKEDKTTVSPFQYASARAVRDLIHTLMIKNLIDVQQVELGPDHAAGDIKVSATMITLNPNLILDEEEEEDDFDPEYDDYEDNTPRERG